MTAKEEMVQEWRERLEDFAHSEMTVQAWCDFNRVSPYQYYYWRRRLAPKTDQTTRPTDPALQRNWMALSVVDIPPLPAPPSGVTIRIAGAEIDVSAGFDPTMLRAVVRALATDPC